jgi:serine/threonine protein kinase
MQKFQIFHRDIKEENILVIDIEKYNVCLADFGFACRQTDTEALEVICGTPGYVDPEVLNGG